VLLVVTAWQIARRQTKEAGYKIKAPKFQPRNPAKQPDALEIQSLKHLEDNKDDEYYVIDNQVNAVRYSRAGRLSKTGLYCHGNFTISQVLWGNDKGQDPTGARMENWKESEIYGAFDVIYFLEDADRADGRWGSQL
jgi:methyl-accepting chemotaxis protein